MLMFQGTLYAKFGISRAELVTQESLNSGSTYDNEDVFGYTLGLGKRGDFYGGTFYKAEFAYKALTLTKTLHLIVKRKLKLIQK